MQDQPENGSGDFGDAPAAEQPANGGDAHDNDFVRKTPAQRVDGAQRKNVCAADYEHELMNASIVTVISKLQARNMRKEADLASRLLLDLCESRISVPEARKVLASLTIADEAAAAGPRTKRTQVFLSVVAGTMLVLAGIAFAALLARIHHHHYRQSGIHRAVTTASIAWQYLPVSERTNVRSTAGDTPTVFTVVNGSDHLVKLYWINYAGEPVLYAAIQPGSRFSQPTYATHPWLITDANEKPSLLVIAGSKAGEILPITR